MRIILNRSSYKVVYLIAIYLNKDIYLVNNLAYILYSLAKDIISIIFIIVKNVIKKDNLYNTLNNLDNIIVKEIITILYLTNN